MFGVLLTCALAERDFFARAMLGCLFYLGGVNNILLWSYNLELSHMKITNIISSVPKWFSKIAFFIMI